MHFFCFFQTQHFSPINTKAVVVIIIYSHRHEVYLDPLSTASSFEIQHTTETFTFH